MCGAGWQFNRHSCYRLEVNGQSFGNAKMFCKTLNAYLVEIQSDAENSFVAGMLKENRNLWIGYTDSGQEGHWAWTNTGKQGTFTNWTSGEPSNQHDQDCAAIWKGKGLTTWDDQGCEQKQSFVCEKGTPGVTTCQFGWFKRLHGRGFSGIHFNMNCRKEEMQKTVKTTAFPSMKLQFIQPSESSSWMRLRKHTISLATAHWFAYTWLIQQESPPLPPPPPPHPHSHTHTATFFFNEHAHALWFDLIWFY